jgi:drug/metabolite transporter (DMT)-like permease
LIIGTFFCEGEIMANPELASSDTKVNNVDWTTTAVFIMVVVIGGGNAVAVRFSNFELPPFWGAALRFASAALIFWAIVLIRRVELPRGRTLFGVLIYGAMTIGISYAFLYWALVYLPASLATVMLTLGPLFTYLFAWAHKQEAFRWRSLIGALIAFMGIVIGLGTEIESSVPLLPLLAIVMGVAIGSEGTVIYKSYPKSEPLAVNAIALTIGTAILILISLIFSESWGLPANQSTWFAYGYLVIGGSVIMFYLFLYVLQRWTASATSYILLLMPIATIILATWLLDEQVTYRFLIGAAVVLVGVWLGAISQPKG